MRAFGSVEGRARVAQLDRALPSGGKGRGFESLRARLCPTWRRPRPRGPAIAPRARADLLMKALTWRSVSGGIAAFVAIVLVLLAVLTYARTGMLRGDKFRLYVA